MRIKGQLLLSLLVSPLTVSCDKVCFRIPNSGEKRNVGFSTGINQYSSAKVTEAAPPENLTSCVKQVWWF